MPEILMPFASRRDWEEWTTKHQALAAGAAGEVLAAVRARGFAEPLSGLERRPDEVQVKPGNLRESLGAEGLNARKRALLLVLAAAGHAAGWRARAGLAVEVPEAATRIAQVVAGHYGRPAAPGQPRRIEATGLADASADAVVVSDAFGQVQDPMAAWDELRRVLRPGGIAVATPEFVPGLAPEAEPAAGMAPGGRCGWGLLAALRARGWSDAVVVAVASSRHGVAADGLPGALVVLARREGGPAGAPLLHPVCWPGALPEKVCLLIALPRSGTTLTTALFDVHSRFDAVYEPWNAKLLMGAEDARLETVLARAKLGREPGRFLFLKETAAQQRYIEHMRALHATMSLPLDRRVLMLCRKPAHTFLSEVERRKEWWGADVEANQEQFDLWCAKTRLALRAMLGLLREAGGSALCYERVAEDPAGMLARLAAAVGFEPEPAQLEFEKHLDTKKVRGDLNVSKNPEPISVESIKRRAGREGPVAEMAARSRHGDWFADFTAFHDLLYAAGILRPDDGEAGRLAARLAE